MKRWRVCFANVKPAGAEGAYDELLLALYTPRGVYVYRHDLRLGMSTNGKATEATGRTITLGADVWGPCDVESWQSALDGAILPKLDESGCERVAEVRGAVVRDLGQWERWGRVVGQVVLGR